VVTILAAILKIVLIFYFCYNHYYLRVNCYPNFAFIKKAKQTFSGSFGAIKKSAMALHRGTDVRELNCY
jgi:hypothetical protein